MKSARMLRLIGEVDEGFVDTVPIEDHLPKKRPIVWIRWASLAACLAVIVSGVGVVISQGDIQSEGTTGGMASISRPPYAGEAFFSPAYLGLVADLQEEDDLFLISFTLHGDRGEKVSAQETQTEQQRLVALGYRIYQKSEPEDQGENEIIGVFSLEELKNFPYNTEYGYYFYMVWNSGRKLNKIVDESLYVQVE